MEVAVYVLGVVAGLFLACAFFFLSTERWYSPRWGLLLLFIGIVLTGGTVCLKWLQEVVKEEAIAKSKTGEAAANAAPPDRPLLSVEVIPNGPLTFRGDNVSLSVQYVIKNAGRAVANEVTVEGRVFVPKWGEEIFQEPVRRQRALCEEVLHDRRDGFAGMPSAIFPNDTKTLGASFGFTKQAMEAGQVKDSATSVPVLFGCATYVGGNQSPRYQTGFIYQVMVFDPSKDPAHPLALRIGEDVPAEKLILVKYAFGGDYAH